jgi:hypothetical protein
MFRMMFIPQFMLAYVILAIIVGLCGRNKYLGFWGFLFLSLLVTPVVTAFFMIITRNRPRAAIR